MEAYPTQKVADSSAESHAHELKQGDTTICYPSFWKRVNIIINTCVLALTS